MEKKILLFECLACKVECEFKNLNIVPVLDTDSEFEEDKGVSFYSDLTCKECGQNKFAIHVILRGKTKVFNETTKTLKSIQKDSSKQDLLSEKEVIIGLFKAHKSLRIKDIVEKTNYDKDIVLQIVSDTTIFRLNINTGRFELKHG